MPGPTCEKGSDKSQQCQCGEKCKCGDSAGADTCACKPGKECSCNKK